MLVGLMSGMGILVTVVTLSHGAAGSRLADHAEAVTPRLYSRCMARQGQDERMLRHKASRFLLSCTTVH